jgi:hypothetical protein
MNSVVENKPTICYLPPPPHKSTFFQFANVYAKNALENQQRRND